MKQLNITLQRECRKYEIQYLYQLKRQYHKKRQKKLEENYN